MEIKVPIAFHLRFGEREHIPLLKKLIESVLYPNGVTMIILEIDKNFIFSTHPNVYEGDHSLTKKDAEDLQTFSRSFGIEIVPLFQCLGHQGWGGSKSALLRAYPEFDETPDIPLKAQWPEIFCRSWCPSHPKVNEIVYDLMDEMIEAFTPKYFHIGMDEVYEIASEQCERCKGKDRADLFAKAVNDMHHHLSKKRGVTVMMWGDRLLDAERFGYDKWEADSFGTHKAIKNILKDIVIVDWHYDERENGFSSPEYFMTQGFSVMPACWYKENVAKDLFKQAKDAAELKQKEDYLFGKLVTSWNRWDKEAYTTVFQYQEGIVGKEDEELWRLYQTLKQVQNL